MTACAFTLIDQNILTSWERDKNKPLLHVLVCLWRKGGGFHFDVCVFVSAFLSMCDCLLAHDRNCMNLWCWCLRFHVLSPAFFVTLSAFNLSRPRPKQQHVRQHYFSKTRPPFFPVMPSAAVDFEEWPMYTLTLAPHSFAYSVVIFHQSVWFGVLFQKAPPSSNIKYMNHSELDSHYCFVNEDVRQVLSQW